MQMELILLASLDKKYSLPPLPQNVDQRPSFREFMDWNFSNDSLSDSGGKMGQRISGQGKCIRMTVRSENSLQVGPGLRLQGSGVVLQCIQLLHYNLCRDVFLPFSPKIPVSLTSIPSKNSLIKTANSQCTSVVRDSLSIQTKTPFDYFHHASTFIL